MLGSLLAGCEESPGETEVFQGRQFKVYRGMGSIAAMSSGSSDRYFQEDNKKLVPEGVEGRVPYCGPVADNNIPAARRCEVRHGILRRSRYRDFTQDTKFIQITNAGLKESHPHDIYITKEAPNYTMNPHN